MKPDSQPEFLCIGGQKCGTSWLHHILAQHDSLSLPECKETHFFEQEELYEKGLDWYLSHFDNKFSDRVVGEINPGYLWAAKPKDDSKFQFKPFRESIPSRVHELLGPNLKLIIMLRDPVRRAISAYVHHLSKGRFEIGDNMIHNFNRMGIAHIGFYDDHIRHWFKTYPRRNFRIYKLEDIRRKKSEFYASVLSFLGVEDFQERPTDKKMQHFMEYKLLDDRTVRCIKPEQGQANVKEGTVILDEKAVLFLENLYSEEQSKIDSLIEELSTKYK